MAQETKAKHINQANKKLISLMSYGLNHGIETIKIRGKGPLVPFVVLEINGERDVTKFFTNRAQAGLNHASKFLAGERQSHLAVIVYDVYISFAGQNFNAVVVKGFDRKDTIGYSVAQRFRPKSFFSSFKLIGSRTFMGNVQQLLK